MRRRATRDRQRSALHTARISPTTSTSRTATTTTTRAESSTTTKGNLASMHDIYNRGRLEGSFSNGIHTRAVSLQQSNCGIKEQQHPAPMKTRDQNRMRAKYPYNEKTTTSSKGSITTFRKRKQMNENENDQEDKENRPVQQQLSSVQTSNCSKENSTNFFRFSKSNDRNSNISISTKNKGKSKCKSKGKAGADNSSSTTTNEIDNNDVEDGELAKIYNKMLESLHQRRQNHQREFFDSSSSLPSSSPSSLPSLIMSSETGRRNPVIPTYDIVNRPPDFDLYNNNNNNSEKTFFRPISHCDETS